MVSMLTKYWSLKKYPQTTSYINKFKDKKQK